METTRRSHRPASGEIPADNTRGRGSGSICGTPSMDSRPCGSHGDAVETRQGSDLAGREALAPPVRDSAAGKPRYTGEKTGKAEKKQNGA